MNTRAAAIVVALLAAAGSARASIINHTDLTAGATHIDLSLAGIDVDVDAAPRPFKPKTVNGDTAVGIAGGAVDAEIDGTESILFTFSAPVMVSKLSVAHLFTTGNFGDIVDESALITTDAGAFLLTADTATTGLWTGSGTVTNVSPGTNSGSGWWMTQTVQGASIFGAPTTFIRLESGQPSSQAKYADFGFVNLCFTPSIPAPATLPAFAFAATLARRRRSSN